MPNERTGAISAHVALEFYEDSKKQYFVVGAVIDSASEGQETTVRYLMDHTRFTEDMFFEGKIPRSITKFRGANSGKIKMWCKTGIEAKKMIKTRFGRIEDKFFTLIPKALAFRPIDDIKDFVYSYVLDEKEVNIDILRENVRTYQELEKTLDSVKRRIAKLEIIEGHHAQVLDGLAKDRMYDYFLQRAEADILGERFSETKSQMRMERYRLEQQEKKIKKTEEEKNERQQIRDALMAELAKDDDFLALDGLKNYPVSITKECMKYQNHVASAIKPAIFETPFIGRNAVRVQLEQAVKEREQISEEINGLEEQLRAFAQLTDALSVDADIDIQYRLDVLVKIRNIRAGIDKCKKNIATLEKNATMIQKQIQLQTLETLISELDLQLGKWNQEKGRYEQKIEDYKQEMERLQAERALKQEAVVRLGAAAGDMLPAWNRDYEKQTEDKSFDQFRDNFARRKKANATTTDHARTNMVNAMVSYKTEHDFGAAPSMEGYPDFADVYERLCTSELLDYEEKVQSARQAAEEEFREQFLAKLQENMKQAQNEFKELNKALRDIIFSNEKYEFLYLPSKRYRHYYEMIMDDFNAIQGESIFSGLFHENHKEVIDELFEKLALVNENSAQALDEFTDYRTYMDYDIKIVHSDGSYSYYSKVCEEKSGGETQTPFYVTVAASFVQLYGNNIGGEAIGLVMFDEAFNNMDDERIGGVLEFLRRLPLQIIIAAPPDKIQYISPSVEETLLVMTDEKVSFVERYHNGAV